MILALDMPIQPNGDAAYQNFMLGPASLALTITMFSAKILNGGMAECSKAAVLKIVECKSSVGSNPTPTAIV